MLTWLTPDGRTAPPRTPGAVAMPLARVVYPDKPLMKPLAAATPEEFGRRGRADPVPDPQAAIEQERKRLDEASRARLRAMTYEELQAEPAKLRARSAADESRD